MHSTYLVVWQMMEEFLSLIINDALHIFGGVTNDGRVF